MPLVQAERARTEEQLQHTNAQLHQQTTDLQQEQVYMSMSINYCNNVDCCIRLRELGVRNNFNMFMHSFSR
jgi:hypothetical protein